MQITVLPAGPASCSRTAACANCHRFRKVTENFPDHGHAWQDGVHCANDCHRLNVLVGQTSLVAFQQPKPSLPSTRQIEWARTKHATTAGSVFPLTNTYQLQVRNCARKVYAGGQHASHAPVTWQHYPAVQGRLKP